MQVGLMRLALQAVAVMWKTPTNVAPFNVFLTSFKGPRFGCFFPSVEGFFVVIEEDVEPLLSNFSRSFFLSLLSFLLRVLHAAAPRTRSGIDDISLD
jgi:hypothetical protein